MSTSNADQTRILMSQATANRIVSSMSRRKFLAVSGGSAALAAFLAACGSDSKGSSGGIFAKNANLFTWAEYDDPDLLSSWGQLNITIYNSTEEAIQKLAAAGGSSGFDLVCPTGVYIPQMVKEDLLEKLDLDRIPNFKNIDKPFTDQDWDPGNQYSVCKDWGTTGWIYDTTVVKSEIVTWADFITATQTDASGQTSVLDVPPELCGIYFWANGISWTTEDTQQLDDCETFLLDNFAEHLKAFDSYPGIALTQGNYALSQVWNGDARQGLIAVEEAGGDPTRYKWAVGTPETELWMDTWVIAKGAKNVDAAYDFINFILDPVNSLKDLAFHGYNTGVAGIQEMAQDLPFSDMIFFTDEEVSGFRAGAVNSAQDRLVDIWNNVKAKASA
ncbi:MAG: spermidine/putrescine ABC transporter substrate-binding protein [Ilumatobacteraceae bacterium]